MESSLGEILIMILIIFALPIILPIILFLGIGAKSKQEANGSNKSTRKISNKNDDGYDKIFPPIFTDEDSSDEEKLLEDLYIWDMLNKDE